MPEVPEPKIRPHPIRRPEPAADPCLDQPRTPHRYAELEVTSNFTFLTGGSHPEEYVEQAARLGLDAVAITDVNSLAGVVRAHIAARQLREEAAKDTDADDRHLPRFLVGTRLVFTDPAAGSALVYPTDRASYGRLCALLTRGRRRAPKGECHLIPQDLMADPRGLQIILIPPRVIDDTALTYLNALATCLPRTDDAISLGMHRLLEADDHERMQQIARLSRRLNIPLVALNDVHYHVPERRALQDVLTCIRHGCTLAAAGRRLFSNGERHLKSPAAMARCFAGWSEAIRRTIEIAERASGFDLDQLRYEYPDEICPVGRTPMQYLTDLVEKGARRRYPNGVPEKVLAQIHHELELIEELSYAPYFLTVHDLVMFARARGILCQGRGAAANSAVCYALGVTAVDPDRVDVLFERFVSRERNEPPDIDIDFEHERREEVIQYIYEKYGRHRAALTATVITYRSRSAIREVGKALGLSLDMVDRLARNIDWWYKATFNEARWRELGLDPNNSTLQRLSELATEIMGFPRHLSQHVGGFVITRGPLSEIVPVENAAMPDRTVIEWDKDDIDALDIMKVDVLGLGMLSCIRKTLDMVSALEADTPVAELEPQESFAVVPPGDSNVYDAICLADTVGVFQIESRAQMSMLPRLRPRCYYDLVIEVAIVRPGPIQGDMVHPYLRRRNGEEPVTYPDETVRNVLEKTLGVPLFQEQAMSLAMHCAGFSPGEADALRRAIAAWKFKKNAIAEYGRRLIEGMTANGYEQEFAERVFRQIQGFSEYGFPESHAASFALIVYASAWLRYYYPAEFAASILNSQPMGFYAPAQLVQDAQHHGIEVHPVDVNHSVWDCTLEGPATIDPAEPGDPWREAEVTARVIRRGRAIRLGMRLVKGVSREDANLIAAAAEAHGEPFQSIVALWRASGVRLSALRRLASSDAFRSMGLDRQAALWTVRSLSDEPMPLFDEVLHSDSPAAIARQEADVEALPQLTAAQEVLHDYATTRLSLKQHPMSFLRDLLAAHDFTTSVDLRTNPDRWRNGQRIRVGGLVLVRQRPATASGIVFMTLEDETGIINLIVRPSIYERYRTDARHSIAIGARGTVERNGDVIHVMVTSIESLDHLVHELSGRAEVSPMSRNFR